MEHDVSRFQSFLVKEEEADEEDEAHMLLRPELYDEELALEREEQELEDRNLKNPNYLGGKITPPIKSI